MKVVRLFFPGEFEDAYLYMGHLLAVSEEHTLKVCNLDRVIDALETRMPQTKTALVHLFKRNDWTASEQFKTMVSDAAIAAAFVNSVEHFPQPYLEVEHGFSSEDDLPFDAHAILDMLLYNGRLYLGTERGLFDVDLDWKDLEPLTLAAPRKRTDAHCLSASAGYGAVNVSCGGDGLLTAFNEFERDFPSSPAEMTRTAPQSVRTAWRNQDLVNYESNTEPLLLESRAKVLGGGVGMEREHTVLEEIGVSQIHLDRLFQGLIDKFAVNLESIQYVFNSMNTLFASTVDGDFYSAGISLHEGEAHLGFARSYKGVGKRVLSAMPTAAGTGAVVVETDDQVLLFAENQWSTLVDSGVLSIRTFPRSKRYKNIVAATIEDGVMLLSILNDGKLGGPSHRLPQGRGHPR